MTKIGTFEDIDAWKKARILAKDIYKVTNVGKFSKDFALRDQIRRAAVSIMSGIAEGFERGGNKEFLYFLSIAKGSAGEVRAQLYVSLDIGYLENDDFYHLYALSEETGKLIGGFMRYLKKSDHKGVKFK